VQYSETPELQFEENKQYRFLIEKFVGEILLLLKILKTNNKKLSDMLQQSIHAISKMGEIGDMYTSGHQKKVQELACAIAREMQLTEEEIENISMAAIIHDIGKVYVPISILNKPGKISDLEYRIIQTHVQYSFDIASEIDLPQQVLTMIFQHHERIDSSGYPQELSGEDIIIGSRILAVADVVDGISSHRPYRQALGIDAALDEILKYKGVKFDTKVVDACIKLFREKHFNWKPD
jgi:putative nucleotidyltransferase with HDIG domain